MCDANHFLDYNAWWDKCFWHAAAVPPALVSSETSWLDDTPFPCSLTSCRSNYPQTIRDWPRAVSKYQESCIYVWQSHTNTHNTCNTQNPTSRSQQKSPHTCTQRSQLQSDSTFIHTQRSQTKIHIHYAEYTVAGRQTDEELLWQVQLCS